MGTTPLTYPIDPVAAAGDAPCREDFSSSGGGRPATVIAPKRGWQAVNFSEIWHHRELLYFLVWRDIKVQYKQTMLGPLWAVLRPLANLLVFSLIFGTLAGLPSDGVPYPIFLYAGMLPWTFFSSALVSSTNSLLSHASLLSKIYFPRFLLPTASVAANVVNLAINFAIYGGIMLWYRHLPGLSVLLLPLLVLLTAMLALGIGCFLAGLTVIYRDIRFVVGSMIGAWMYLSPVIYPMTLVPEGYRWLLVLNPMTGIIGAFRSVLLNQPVPWSALGFSVAFALAMFVIGFYFFHRTERRVVDVA